MKRSILLTLIIILSISFLRAQTKSNVSPEVRKIGDFLSLKYQIEDDLIVGDYREDGSGWVLFSNHTGLSFLNNEKTNELIWVFGQDKGNIGIEITAFKNELNENKQLQIESQGKYLVNIKSNIEIELFNIDSSKVLNLKRTKPIPNRTYSQLASIKEKYKNKLFSAFSKNYIEEKISVWQKKGEYEKTVDLNKRVTEKTRKEKIEYFKEEALDAYVESVNAKLTCSSLKLGKYDADKEVYTIKSNNFGDLHVPVPIDEAEKFSWDWCDYNPTYVIYYIINDELGLAKATFFDKYVYENPLAKNRKITKKEIANELSKAMSYYRMNEYKQALTIFQKVNSLDPKSISRSDWCIFGHLSFEAENYTKVIECYNNFLKIDDDNETYFHPYYLAVAYLKLKDFEKSKEAFSKIITKDEHNEPKSLNNPRGNDLTTAMNYIGECYNGLGEYEKAIKWFNFAINKNPNRALAYFNLGKTYELMGKKSKAKKALEKAAILKQKEN